MDDSFCVSALERALRLYPKPAIFNTDQGAQFTGKNFTGVLKQNRIGISMDGKGRCMDNIFIFTTRSARTKHSTERHL